MEERATAVTETMKKSFMFDELVVYDHISDYREFILMEVAMHSL